MLVTVSILCVCEVFVYWLHALLVMCDADSGSWSQCTLLRGPKSYGTVASVDNTAFVRAFLVLYIYIIYI